MCIGARSKEFLETTTPEPPPRRRLRTAWWRRSWNMAHSRTTVSQRLRGCFSRLLNAVDWAVRPRQPLARRSLFAEPASSSTGGATSRLRARSRERFRRPKRTADRSLRRRCRHAGVPVRGGDGSADRVEARPATCGAGALNGPASQAGICGERRALSAPGCIPNIGCIVPLSRLHPVRARTPYAPRPPTRIHPPDRSAPRHGRVPSDPRSPRSRGRTSRIDAPSRDRCRRCWGCSSARRHPSRVPAAPG